MLAGTEFEEKKDIMEQGAKSLLIILCVALVMGAGVIAIKPSYRAAFAAIVRGEPQASPIWESNQAYYPDIQLETAGTDGAGDEAVDLETLP